MKLFSIVRLISILIGAVLIISTATGGNLYSITGGYDTLSLSDAKSVSNDPILNGEAMQANIVFSGSGNSLQGSFDALSLGAKARDVQVFQGFQLIGTAKVKCNYDIIESNDVLSTYSYTSVITGDNRVAQKFANSFYGRGSTWFGWNYVLSPAYKIARPSSITKYAYSVDLQLKVGDKTLQGTIDPQTDTVMFGDLAYAKFEGGLVGKISCPNPSSTTVLTSPINSKDYTANALDSYYLGKTDLQFSTPNPSPCINTQATSADFYTCVGNSISPYNSKVNSIVNSKPPAEGFCEFSQVNGTLIYSCDPTVPPIYPNILVGIKASEIFVKADSSNPAIQSIEWQKPLIARTPFSIQVKIKNIGNANSAFDVSANCISSQISQRLNIDSGQFQTATLQFNGFASNEKCTFLAKNVNNANLKDEKELTIEIVNPACKFACCIGSLDYQDKVCPEVNKNYILKNCNETGCFVTSTTTQVVIPNCVNFACEKVEDVVFSTTSQSGSTAIDSINSNIVNDNKTTNELLAVQNASNLVLKVENKQVNFEVPKTEGKTQNYDNVIKYFLGGGLILFGTIAYGRKK